ncbi:extracellular calcium-sensing receptor-like [Protopterus annectens]|uniref:extracellular calcium-sensing receptor-like n=1 Tax=Protopterus annectens TaxID=7888 RepID=UPI001CFA395B|nr:extracellular calcium-sensing receptor-like [Protopterus annectens]
MVFAIKEINENPTVLPNITLGFKIYDCCYSEIRALEGTVWLLSRQQDKDSPSSCGIRSRPSAILGALPSKSSLPMARILGIFRYPQISYGSAYPSLSDKTQFPSFFRTVPSDKFQSIAIAQLVKYFDWQWIGILASQNDLGEMGSQALKTAIVSNGRCVAFLETLATNNFRWKIPYLTDVIKKSSANVIVLYSTIEPLIPLLEEITSKGVTGKVWIGTTFWSISSDFSKQEILKTLNGSLGVAVQRGEIARFRDFLYNIHPYKFPNDIFITDFWETAFGCQWSKVNSTKSELGSEIKPCTGTEKVDEIDNSLFDAYSFRFTYSSYVAAHTVGQALQSMFFCNSKEQSLGNVSCENIHNVLPWKLVHYLKSVHFTTTAGHEIYFDENGDIPASYDILNWQLFPNGTSRYYHVGRFDTSSHPEGVIDIDDRAVWWNGDFSEVPRSVCSENCQPGHRKAARRGEPICCFDCIMCSKGEIANRSDATGCLKCPKELWSNDRQDKCIQKLTEVLSYEDPLGAVLAAINCAFGGFTISILCVFIRNQETPIVRANNRELSYILLLALMMCFLCSLLFIGQPTGLTCLLRQPAFGVVFSLAISCILAKTVIVIIAFRATQPGSNLRKWLGTRLPSSVVFGCTLIQILLCSGWMIFSPSFPESNMESGEGTITFQCNDGSVTTFWGMLGYMGLLASVSLIVAFLARNLPDNFNDAKYITFSMLVFASVWLSFIPAYLSTKGRYPVAVEVFAILASTAGMLICIFFPKCYIILLRPDLNNRDKLMESVKVTNKTLRESSLVELRH